MADPYTGGTSGLTYGFLRTPGIQNVNLSLIKRIPLTERVGGTWGTSTLGAREIFMQANFTF